MHTYRHRSTEYLAGIQLPGILHSAVVYVEQGINDQVGPQACQPAGRRHPPWRGRWRPKITTQAWIHSQKNLARYAKRGFLTFFAYMMCTLCVRINILFCCHRWAQATYWRSYMYWVVYRIISRTIWHPIRSTVSSVKYQFSYVLVVRKTSLNFLGRNFDDLCTR